LIQFNPRAAFVDVCTTEAHWYHAICFL